jgi:hypothetical protein
MTHPDDEISICAWIRRLTANGNEVYVSWTHSTPVREAESRKVAAQLGVPQENLIFFGASDGRVSLEFLELLSKFRTMVESVNPDVIACGAFEQGHPDHDTTNVLVNSAFAGEVLEIPFYHTYATRLQQMNSFSDTVGQSMLLLTPEEVKLRSDLSSREMMRRQGHKVFRIPNHPAGLATKVEQSETWQTWCKNVLPHL